MMKSDIILTRVQTGHRDAEEKRKRMTAFKKARQQPFCARPTHALSADPNLLDVLISPPTRLPLTTLEDPKVPLIT